MEMNWHPYPVTKPAEEKEYIVSIRHLNEDATWRSFAMVLLWFNKFRDVYAHVDNEPLYKDMPAGFYQWDNWNECYENICDESTVVDAWMEFPEPYKKGDN